MATSPAQYTADRRDPPLTTSNDRGVWRARILLFVALAVVSTAAWLAWGRRAKETPAAPVVRSNLPPEVRVGGRVVLGSPSLFAGIPGGAKLSIEEIQDWLDDPRNHEPLDFELPLWLRGARGDLTVPADDPLTRAKIELGRQLFMDRRFANQGFNCLHCHHPKQGYSRPTRFTAQKNPLPIFNRILSTRQFWDGRAPSLEGQVAFPVRHPQEMGTSTETCEQQLLASPGYRMQLERIYGGVSFQNMARAIAAFERALVTGPGAYDYYRVQQELGSRESHSLTPDERRDLEEANAGAVRRPMSDSARRGMELFFSSRTDCATCHAGPNFTDEQFHNLGIGAGVSHLHEMGQYSIPDDGRMNVTHDEADYATFKTPTLRNLRDTGAYFHDGRGGTLEQAVRLIAKGGVPNKNLSPLVRDLDLSDEEVADLVAFLDSLQGDLAIAATDHLPEMIDVSEMPKRPADL